MSEQEQFKDINYCRSEILEVRKWTGDKSKLSEHTFGTAFNILGMMLFHCPEEFVSTVYAHLHETNLRYFYWNELTPK